MTKGGDNQVGRMCVGSIQAECVLAVSRQNVWSCLELSIFGFLFNGVWLCCPCSGNVYVSGINPSVRGQGPKRALTFSEALIRKLFRKIHIPCYLYIV